MKTGRDPVVASSAKAIAVVVLAGSLHVSSPDPSPAWSRTATGTAAAAVLSFTEVKLITEMHGPGDSTACQGRDKSVLGPGDPCVDPLIMLWV